MNNRRASLLSPHLGRADDMLDTEGNDGSNPSSKLLQDLLRERKAQSRNVEKAHDNNPRSRSGRNNSLDIREVQSSPTAPPATRDVSGNHGRRSSAFGAKTTLTPKEWGMREIDEVGNTGMARGIWLANIQEQQLARLNKENFDLKLEVSQRRKRQEILNAQLERLPALETDNAELHSINEALLRELEQRDQAIKEAVELICELEEKVEAARLSKSDQGSHSPESGSNAQDVNEPSSSPPLAAKGSPSAPPAPCPEEGQDQMTNAPNVVLTGSSEFDNTSPTEPLKTTWRTPSFIREKKRSTRALRGLFMSNENFLNSNLSLVSLPRPASVFGKDDIQEETDPDYCTLNSPRLSILSESSFMSVYGKHQDPDQASNDREGDAWQDRVPSAEQSKPILDSTKGNGRLRERTEEWNKPSTPSKRSTSRGHKDPFTSIGEVLRKVPSGPLVQPQRSLDQDYDDIPMYKHGHILSKIPSLSGPIFGGDVLPPTPDTMSTHRKDANSSTPSIITEKSLVDGTPYPAKNISVVLPGTHAYLPNDTDDFKLSNESCFEAAMDLDKSEDESESIQVEQSDSSAFEDSQPFSQAPTFMGGSQHASRPSRTALPTRPPLTTYATDMMFNGEGYDAMQPSQRTVSYPAPSPRVRQHSNQPPPLAYDAASARSTQLSPQNNMSGSSNTATPTKNGHADKHSRSPSLHKTTSATSSNRSGYEPPPGTSSNSSSTRSRIPKQPPTPTPLGHSSLASRIFRRSSVQTAHTKPSSFEHPASNHPARALSVAFGKPRPSSGQFEANAPQPPSRIGRPGTAGSQTDLHPSASRRQSAVFDDIVNFANESESRQGDIAGKNRSVELGRTASLRSKIGLGWRRGKGE